MNYFNFLIPQSQADHKILANVVKGAESFIIANASQQHQSITCVVTPDTQTALYLQKVLTSLSELPTVCFPDWQTLPYDNFSPHQTIISERLNALHFLRSVQKGIFILPINTLMQRLCPPAFLDQNVFQIKKGEKLDFIQLCRRLTNVGYRAVEQVLSHGEYALRGSLLDLFPMGSNKPYRLDFLDDEIDSIRIFDVDSQRSLRQIDEIHINPAHEFPTNKQGIETFRLNFRKKFPEIRRDDEHLYHQVSKGTMVAGIEYWQPLFFDEATPLASFFDYLPNNTLFIDWAENQCKGEQFYQEAEKYFVNRGVDPMRPCLPPDALWLKIDAINAKLKAYPRLSLKAEKVARTNIRQQNLPLASVPDITLQAQSKQPLHNLSTFLQDFDGQTVFIAETAGRRETLLELLSPLKLALTQITSLNDLTAQHNLWISPLQTSFILTTSQQRIAFICENALLGAKVQYRQTQSVLTNPDALIRNLAQLRIGQPVVHLEHGIGRYQGLVFIENAGIASEFLLLEYADNAKLYVPVTHLNLISRYLSGNEEHAPLHKLGNDSWSKARNKALEKIRDVAAELLDVYAQRGLKKGFAFHYDKVAFQQFSATFPFEETEDQKRAINAVISDMTQPKPMDRLICGDVGFGKTEVAIRATFLAVMNHKQVVILVPTTLLAKQHYETFRDRFAELPINVAMLSRFNSTKAEKQILTDLAAGKVDILIGTHKVLQDNVKFDDLGLLIIDEEHRFGVRQKEMIKALRSNVDILTLTATPIPRTLNMAMNGIRDLCVIATPPARRLTVKTFVREKDKNLIREAILREILRGGQVYYLHNDVATIELCAEELANLVPEARIIIGHGQMRKRELERVMTDFHHQRFNVLVCSTIIETGIDIPTANTIIIERADKFGLAQLHQLRGRVGRSHHQAYAYFLTPPPTLMSKDAQKRLVALESLDILGAGFLLATQDLEIRGAGELLGHEQSGQIESIGFGLYMDLLEKAINALQNGEQPTQDILKANQTAIDLGIIALIPENYLNDVNLRLSFYKRIAATDSQQGLDELKIELIDRFGLLPESVKNLFTIAELRLQIKPLNIKQIKMNAKGGFIEFHPQTKVDPIACLTLIQQNPHLYRFNGENKFCFKQTNEDPKARLEFIQTLLNALTPAENVIN